MKKISLKTGTAIVPEEWKEVPIERTGNEDYVAVVEMRGGGFPHFYFLTETYSISARKQQEIIKSIVDEHPWFEKKVLHKQVDAVYDERGRFINAAEWDAAPIIGFFVVEDEGIPYLRYPYGAMVIRDAK